MQTSYLRGVPFCLVATVSWGCMFPVMTSALTQMDPFNFTDTRSPPFPSPSCSWGSISWRDPSSSKRNVPDQQRGDSICLMY